MTSLASKPTIVSPALPLVCALLAACTDPGPGDDEIGSTTAMSGSESGDESDTDADTFPGDTSLDTETETGDPEPVCGNGALEGPELCDDGNTIDDDACSNACAPPICAITWSQIDDAVTINTSALDGTPIDELPSGDLVTAHAADGQSSIDVRVQVWTPTGELVWEVIHELGELRDGVGDVLGDPSGDVLLGGGANVGTDGVAMVLRLSGSDGSELWRFERDSELAGSIDRVTALDFDDQGRVLAAVFVENPGTGGDVELHALDPATGVSQWTGQWASEGEGEDQDWPAALVFDAQRARSYLLVSSQVNAVWSEPTLLAFEAPSEEPVLVTTPFDDGNPDNDGAKSLALDASGRLWAQIDDDDPVDGWHMQLVELDPDDGSAVQTIDSRDLPLESERHYSGIHPLTSVPTGGLGLVGWIPGNQELDIDHYGFVLALEESGQTHCVARFNATQTSANYLLSSFAASDGAIYSAGYASFSGDWHNFLLRIR